MSRRRTVAAQFILTFFGYSSFHVSRKAFSLVKPELIHWPHFDDTFEGDLDFAFLIAYAIGLPLFGRLGDSKYIRQSLFASMLIAGLCCILFGLGPNFGFPQKWFYIFAWGVGGFFQSSGWPTLVAVMGRHLDFDQFGLLFGMWSASASFGNLVGAWLAALVLNSSLHPQWVFFFAGQTIICMAVLLFLMLKTEPIYPDVDAKDVQMPLVPKGGNSVGSRNQYRCRMPLAVRVLSASMAYAVVKLVNYSCYNWLPSFLESLFPRQALADEISSAYDIGGIVGGILIGFLADFFFPTRRSFILAPSVMLSAGAFLIYHQAAPTSPLANGGLLFLCGIMLNGSASVLSSVTAASLSENKNLIATVTGIVDAAGSVGGAIGQLIVPLITENGRDDDAVFPWLCFNCLVGALCLIPLVVHEARDFWHRQN